MNNIITDTFVRLFKTGRKTRISSSGWTSGNAPCCVHRGQNPDKRGRGGIKLTKDGGISYNCFNCSYTASYVPGRYLNYKFRKLLEWTGADPGDIERLVIEALRIKELTALQNAPIEPFVLPDFPSVELPPESNSVWEMFDFATLSNQPYSDGLVKIVDYIASRKIDFRNYNFYASTSKVSQMNRRVIVPFLWGDKTVGYTARLMDDGFVKGMKYYTKSPPNYVFNMNAQRPNGKFVIVSEGPFDAMSVDGVAVLGNGVSDIQAEIIDSLDREVIVVADEDSAGKELIKHALEYGWTVSFPAWRETAKDINEAVTLYGKLYVLKAILAGKETNPLKIKLRAKGLNFA